MPARAQSSSCPALDIDDALQSYPVVLKAKVLDTKTNFLATYFSYFANGPDSTTVVEVDGSYKGDLNGNLEIQHFRRAGSEKDVSFIKGANYIVFLNAQTADGKTTYSVSKCSDVIYISQPDDLALKKLEGLAKEFQLSSWKVLSQYSNEEAGLRHIIENVPPDAAQDIFTRYKNQSECRGGYEADAQTPSYLKDFPPPAPPGLYLSKRKDLLPLGIALYKFGNFKAAARALCLAEQNPEPRLWRILSLQKLGMYREDMGKPFDVSGVTVEKIRIDGLNAGVFDFSHSHLTGISMNGADFSKSNFIGASLKDVSAANAKFTGADFTGAALSGTYTNADFTNVKLISAAITGADFSGANFDGADIQGTDWSGVTPENLSKMKFHNAVFSEKTLWPAGYSPLQNGAVLRGPSTPLETPLSDNQIYDIANGTPDPLTIPSEGTYQIDGVHIRGYYKVLFQNSKPNLVKVFNSGLIGGRYVLNRGNPAENPFKNLEIRGDPGVDVVMLDGCFTWEISPDIVMAAGNDVSTFNFRLRKYKASAASGQQAEVLIQESLKVAFSKECHSLPPEAAQNSADTATAQTPTVETGADARKLELLVQKVRTLEQYWASAQPPNALNEIPLPEGNNNCPKGYRIYNKAGLYVPDIPPGCRHVLVKAWGAGGGGHNGGPSGFTMGIIDFSEKADIKAIVGGAGSPAKSNKGGQGGFNGGGDGGDASPGLQGGNGGGGRSELLVNGKPVIIAGGGGGGGHGKASASQGYPGGGRDTTDIEAPYRTVWKSLEAPQNLAGSQGKGGMPEPERVGSVCVPAQAGGEKTGGKGASGDSCPGGGSGGGGGFGAGAGGKSEHGYSGGGGGLAPPYGLTLWGRANGHLPADVDDLYHGGFSGRGSYDGLIAVIWPAPAPETFLETIAKHDSDVTPFVQDKTPREPGITLNMSDLGQGDVVIRRAPDGQGIMAQTPADESSTKSRISHYRQWADNLPVPKARELLRMMANLMDAGRLPSQFLSWNFRAAHPEKYLVTSLPLSPSSLSVIDVGSKCSSDASDSRAMTIIKSESTDARLDNICPGDNQFYVLGDGSDEIADSLGNDIFYLGAGNDTLRSGVGSSLILLEKGWGKKKISKDCSNAEVKESAIFAVPQFNTRSFSGIGLGFTKSRTGEGIVKSVMQGSPAERAGLKERDMLLTIDGQSIFPLSHEEASKMIRGPEGTKVTLTYSRDKNISSTAVVTREALPMSSLQELNSTPTSHRWPYRYTNFIIFGPGIAQSDMEHKSTELWVNKQTGDSLEASPCFNMVFTDGSPASNKGPGVP